MAVGQQLHIEPPSLPRRRKVPRCIDEGVSFSSCEDKICIIIMLYLILEITNHFEKNDIHCILQIIMFTSMVSSFLCLCQKNLTREKTF